MKEFWKDYWDLCKHSGQWYKKHWKGYLVLMTVILGAEYGWLFREQIKEKVTEKIEEHRK